MSNILKKITSIEPDEADILKAINAESETAAQKTVPSKTQAPETTALAETVSDDMAFDDTAPNNTAPNNIAKKSPIISSIEEIDVDDDPVPEFITREGPSSNEIATPKEATETPQPLQADTPIQKNLETPIDRQEPLITPTATTPDLIGTGLEASPATNWMNWVGIVCALIWIAASFSYFYGFFELRQKWTDLSPMQIFGLVMAILLPAILLALLFYALRQLSNLSLQSHKLARAAYQLTQPDDSVVAKTSLMASAIKTEVDGVDGRIDQALARMSTLEAVLKERTQSLEQASGQTSQTTDEIASRLSTQRLALESIAGTFDNRMAMLSSSLTEHTTKLDGSTQIAEQKIQEARVSVEGAAERINAASDVVRSNTINAASTLTKSHEEIENLANMIRERSAELDEVYRKHAQDLTGMIAQLRDEQQNLSISLDERLSKMRDMSLAAKVSAESLTDASEAGRNTVEALATATRLTDTAVKQRFVEMEDMVKFSSEKAENISDQAARRVQDSLMQTRKEISRIEDDMMVLQNKLSSSKSSQNTSSQIPQKPQDKLSLEEPKQPKKKSRGRLRLRPVRDEDTPTDELEIPDLRSSLVSEPPASPQEALDLELDRTNEIVDRPAPVMPSAPQADIIAPVEPTDTTDGKTRSGWRWRDMLGGLDRPDAPQALSPEQALEPIQRNVSDERMIASLSALGLAPAAIIDDGCIIEATNTRRSKGASAMSQTVSQRIGGPIRHLHRAMEKNAALKTDAQIYVSQFNTGLKMIETDREAIRARLESDAGRAFLLCDAALNG